MDKIGGPLQNTEWSKLGENIQEEILDALAEDLEIASSEETAGVLQKAGLTPHTHGWRECLYYLFSI